MPMNVKSKFDTEEEFDDNQRKQYMRGMCATPLSLFAETTRMDASTVKAPKFLKWIFQTMGWKIEPDKRSDN
jgi:hypothetical protein